MRQLLRVTISGLFLGTLWATAAAAADADADKSRAVKDTRIEFTVHVTGGTPQKPIGNAEVSIKGPDGGDLLAPRRTDKKGDARFHDLRKGEIVVVVIVKDWKTYRAMRVLGNEKEGFSVILQPLD